jgi:hypothetical protein
VIGRSAGTVRNQMQSLKTLGLVDGVPGPKGGYRATRRAYEELSITWVEDEADVPVYRNGKETDVTVEDIDLRTLRHPYICNASIKMIGNIRIFDVGDIIQVGPTPVNNLVVHGEVIGRDDTNDILLCRVLEIVSLPKRSIIEIAKELITIPSDASVEDALGILLKNDIKCAPIVEGEDIVGIVSLTEMGSAYTNEIVCDTNVMDIAIKDVISVEGDKTLLDAMKLMNEHKIGSLIVMEEGDTKGIITKADLLKELVSFSQ